MLIGQDKKENNRVTVSLMRVQTVRTFHEQQNHEKNCGRKPVRDMYQETT